MAGDQADPAPWIVPTGETPHFHVSEGGTLERTFRPFYEVGEGIADGMVLDLFTGGGVAETIISPWVSYWTVLDLTLTGI